MDVLGEVLRSLNVFSHSLGTLSLAAPWSLAVPASRPWCTIATTLLEGDFWVVLDKQAPVQLKPGDAFMVTNGAAFRVCSDPALAPLPMDQIWRDKGLPEPSVAPTKPLHMDWGSGTAHTEVFTTAFTVQDPTHNPLLAQLPPLIVVRRGESDLDIWADAARRFCERETDGDAPGFSATSLNLIKMILGCFIRAYVNSQARLDPSWMKGLSDPRIGRALAIMQLRCEEHWTVATLADEVGMARSTFARVFHELVGKAPMKYLVDCRMQAAVAYLVDKQLRISEVSERVGYHSERAFRQAFRQCFGAAPGGYVRQFQV
jgi:AraC-like DNA-binding protein